MQSTGLTPSLSRISIAKVDESQLQTQVSVMLSNNLIPSALHFAERLYKLTKSIAHGVLFARCHYLANEKRRCLGVLEQLGYLGADSLQVIRGGLLGGDTVNRIGAVLLAAHCLFDLEQYEDCVALVDPLVGMEKFRIGFEATGAIEATNAIAAIYSVLGRSYGALENRSRAIRYLLKAVELDPYTVEVVDYLLARSLLTPSKRAELLADIEQSLHSNHWLVEHYRFVLDLSVSSEIVESASGSFDVSESQLMVVRAERLYEQYFSDKACRLARKAYSLDPYNWRGLSIYIACLCDLEYKTELFYLSHELVESYPKKPLTWYAVGCYYWCCKKLELAHKFFLRATKLDKSFALAWVAVGVVLSAQEETEHALSAFRAACRLLPGQHMPMFFLAKELARTNNYALALQVLQGALEMSPDDAMVLNELGALYLQQHRLEEAYRHLSRAAQPLRSSKALRSPHDYVVLSNMGTCLRKLGRLVEALEWYSLALSDRAGDASTHANIGYTLHLQGDLGAAIESYHRALSLDPSLSFCSEMLNRAMDDVDCESSTTTAVGEDCRLVNQSSAMEDSASSSIFTPFSQRLGF